MSKLPLKKSASPAAPKRGPVVVRLALHGDPRVLLADGRAVTLERRAAALCALAAIETGATRERAARWLWPDSDDPRRNLRQQLLRFRRGLEAPLLAEGDTLALASGVSLDAAESGAALLGELDFADCPEFAAWLDVRRNTDRATHTAALRERIARAEADGDLDAASATAEALVSADPDREAHHRELMRLHYLRGDSAAGLAAHRRLVRLLADTHHARPHADTEALAQALREAAVPTVAAPRTLLPTLLRPPRLVGRAHELAAVRDAWSGGDIVLLLGGAGMGKTRLIEALCLATAQAVPVAGATAATIARAQGRPGDASVPFATLARLLRSLPARTDAVPVPQRLALTRVLPELAAHDPCAAAPVAGAGQLAELQAAVQAWIEQSNPALLVVDDLHFADPGSLQMLARLATDALAAPRRWLLARRPAEGDAAVEALHNLLADGARLAEVVLRPMDAQTIAELIESLGLPQLDTRHLAPQLVSHTGGNPLFVLETLKARLLRSPADHGPLPRPANVGALIERRLRQLSPQALALARVAAVAGVDFDITAAEAVLAAPTLALADAWAELESAQVLRDGAFAHDLVQEAALRSLPQPVAARLHAQVAEHLQGRADAEPARVAAHWLAAGQSLAAVPHLLQASERAHASLQQITAGDLLLAAAQALAEADRRSEAFDLLFRCAGLWVDLTDETRARDLRERMFALAATDAQWARAHMVDARLHELTGQQALMRASGERVLAHAERCGDLEMQAHGLEALATEAYWGGRLHEALPQIERARGLWTARSMVSDVARCTYSIGVILQMLGRLEEADANFEGGAVQLESIADWGTLVQLLRERALLRINMGQRAQAAELLQRALQLLTRLEPSAEMACSTTGLMARTLRRGGRYADALALLDNFDTRFPLHRSAAFWDVALERAVLLLELGRPHLALQAMEPMATRPDPPLMLRYRLQQMRLWLRAAGTPVVDDDADLPAALPPLLSMALQRAAARLKPAAERVDELAEMHALALQRNQRAEAVGLLAERVQALHEAGQADEAEALALPLCDQLATLDALIYPPAARWAAHQALAGRKPQKAAAELKQAVDWLALAVRTQVPEEFLKSFVERNPVNRAVLAAALQCPAARMAARAVMRAAG